MTKWQLLLSTALGSVFVAGATTASAQCTFPNASAYWGCQATLSGTSAQSTDNVLAYRASLGQPGQAPLSVQQINNSLLSSGGTFSSPVTLNAGGGFVGTFTGSPTFQGVPSFSAGARLFSTSTIDSAAVIQLTSPVLAGNTGTIPPIWNMRYPALTGTLGAGGTSTRAPAWVITRGSIVSDNMILNNSNIPHFMDFIWNFGNGSGGRSGGQFQLKQQGPMTPDNGHQASYGGFSSFVNMTANVGGTDTVHTNGLVYGANYKTVLGAGATYFGAENSLGETNTSTVATTGTLIISGSVTPGDTISLTIASTSFGFSITDSYIVKAGDTVATVVTGLGAAVLADSALQAQNIGPAFAGAGSTLNSTLEITSPQYITDLTIVPGVTGSGSETITLTGTTTGASVANRYGGSFVLLRDNGTAGYVTDAVFLVGKQSTNFTPATGGWKSFLMIAGQGVVDTEDTIDGAFYISGWPFDPHADLIAAQIPSQTSTGHDAPIPTAALGSVINLGSITFTGNPINLPGYTLLGNGDSYIGSGHLERLTGNAAAAGLAIVADGCEGTSTTLVNGGGSPNTIVPNYRYFVGDKLTDIYTGHYTVLSVDNKGAILTYSTDVAPSSHGTACPSGTLSLIGGSGTGALMGVTWTQANTVSVSAAQIPLNGQVTFGNTSIPTAATCGGTGVIDGNNTVFDVAFGGTSSATCTITPGTSYTSAPKVEVTSKTPATGACFVTTSGTSQIVITCQTATTNGTLTVHAFPTA